MKTKEEKNNLKWNKVKREEGKKLRFVSDKIKTKDLIKTKH